MGSVLRFANMLLVGAITLSVGSCAGDSDATSKHVPLPPPASPQAALEQNFESWLISFRREAIAAGIRPDIFDTSMKGLHPDEQIIAADRNQPEFAKPVWEYLSSSISDKRVQEGQQLLADNRALFDRIEATYQVDREVVAAIWGLESNFGSFMGSQSVLRSLATLAFEGRRRDYGHAQLIAALKIIQSGDITADGMKGSWAGAMGHTQFIPTTYLAQAVDLDGDGKRDIWNSRADALGSTAHYLKTSGWEVRRPWGYEVRLPSGFDYSMADMSVSKSLDEWKALGVTRFSGTPLSGSDGGVKASVFLPSGHKGPAFVVLKNFRVVLTYNASTSYSLAVNLLADRFRGRGGVTASWPLGERPLTRSERIEMQRLLNDKGFDTGGADGIIGFKSRGAIRAYQKKAGLPADGYPTASLLAVLRGR
jgi:membrane-bound lytic murein transglycosylase B